MGVDGLRALAGASVGAAVPSTDSAPGTIDFVELGALTFSDLVEQIAAAGSGVVMTMGKGGVGKTTIAAAIAVELSRMGHTVHLSTTDPAAHVAATVGAESDLLSVSRIDPAAEVAAYRDRVMSTVGSQLDADARALLDEDLRSPCTEEIAVFHAFAHTVAGGADRFVILDTAPTGHTLLLLDASEAYHREVLRTQADTPPEVLELLGRLRDPVYTKVLVVTLAEATPVSEAARLQDDLRRAGIEPFAWVVDQSMAPVASTDPTIQARGANEWPFLTTVARQLSRRTVVVPWVPEPPRGHDRLSALVREH
jgi:arsenite-transporting ATPase